MCFRLRASVPLCEIEGEWRWQAEEFFSGRKGVRWNGSRRAGEFWLGEYIPPATITFGYLSRPLDKFRYASSEFQYIAFDELTDFSEEDYLFLFSRLRKNKSLA